MCGRFTLHSKPEEIQDYFGLDAAPEYTPSYNIAPTQNALVIRQTEQGLKADMLHWGLIPSWAKAPSIGNHMINARVETVAEKPSFRVAYKKCRCIVPANGFYEWKKEESGKQPYYIHPIDAPLIGMAGLWEQWEDPDQLIESFTIITTEANDFMRHLHARMPVILSQHDYSVWMDGSTTQDTGSLAMDAYPVRRQVNSPSYNEKGCIASKG